MKGEEQVLIKCIFCKANFRTKVFLEKHIMEKHVIRKDNLLYCPYCILVTDNDKNMKHHIVSHVHGRNEITDYLVLVYEGLAQNLDRDKLRRSIPKTIRVKINEGLKRWLVLRKKLYITKTGS